MGLVERSQIDSQIGSQMSSQMDAQIDAYIDAQMAGHRLYCPHAHKRQIHIRVYTVAGWRK